MTKHAKKFLEKRAALEEKETELREAIENETEVVESNFTKYATAGGILLVAVGIGYILYRTITGEDDDTSETKKKSGKKKKSKAKTDDGPVAKLINRVSEVAITGLISAITNYLSKSKKED